MAVARILSMRVVLLIISCAAFDELRNIWSIAQRTCGSVKVRARVRVSFRVRVRERLVQMAKCAARLVKRAD